jgi:hypothetical protein
MFQTSSGISLESIRTIFSPSQTGARVPLRHAGDILAIFLQMDGRYCSRSRRRAEKVDKRM